MGKVGFLRLPKESDHADVTGYGKRFCRLAVHGTGTPSSKRTSMRDDEPGRNCQI